MNFQNKFIKLKKQYNTLLGISNEKLRKIN